MAAEIDPKEAIDLVASGDEAVSTKKRPLEDDLDPDTSLEDASSLHDSKRARTDPPQTVEPEPQGQKPVGEDFLSAEEGEIEEEKPQVAAISDSFTSETPPQPRQVAGWNPTISKTITRTSLSEPANGTTAHGDGAVFHQDSSTFKLPNLSERREGSWLERFKDWVCALQEINSELAHIITPALAQSAYLHYIDEVSGLKPKKRRSAKQASKEVESTGTLAALLQNIQSKTASQINQVPQTLNHSTAQRAPRGKGSRASSDGEDRAADDANDESSESEAEYEPTLSKSEHTGGTPSANNWAELLDRPAKANGNTLAAPRNEPIMTKRNVPTGALALDQQRRYFPSASDPTQMCLLCGRGTHLASSCPTLVCSFCESLDHPDLRCPTRVRCKRCRQLGHQVSQCVEKLALTKGEGLACSICKSRTHLEGDCTQVWRSFHPDAGTVKKVAFIPASCSICGSNQHFALDCNQGSASNPTWSAENRDKYVDPVCGLSSIEATSGGQEKTSTLRAPELKIRGHAARTTNVHYSESDDSDVEFLGHKPVNRRAPVGQIRMASNIQMPQNAMSQNDRPTRRNNGRGQSQPPLPPGPPPPRPPPTRQSSITSYVTRSPAPPPPSLPAKPPASTRGYQNAPPPPSLQNSSKPPQGPRAKGGQGGGRGGARGRGGRGRGRGRGK